MRFDVKMMRLVSCSIAAVLLIFSSGVFSQEENTVEYWQSAVQKSPADAKAWFNLGILYENGQGVQANKLKAQYHYNKAVELGYAPAMYNLGSIYAQQKEYDKARQWWEKAAELNVPEAQYNLGMLYEKGWGVNIDPKLSATWYQRAAETALKKYLQLYQRSRSQLDEISGFKRDSLSILDHFQIIKTASAANFSDAQVQQTADKNQPTESAEIRLAQAANSTDGAAPGNLSAWGWIYAQPEANFTIQLFATKEEDKTEKFIQQYALSEKAQTIRAVVKGTIYYKVLYGSFAEWNDAAVEIGTFPQDLRDQRPWVRKFSTLYKELPEGTDPSGSISQTNDVQQDSESISESNDTQPDQAQTQTQSTQAQVEQTVLEQPAPENTESATVSEQAPQDSAATEETTTEVDAAVESESEVESEEVTQAEDSTQTSIEDTSVDTVLTPYARQQLASDSLPESVKTQLKSGLDAIASNNHDDAFSQLSDLAGSGLAEAQFWVGLMYSQGKGVNEDANKAFEMIKLAAEQGHPYAQQSLANFYDNGIGVEPNSSLSAYWRQTSSDNIKKLEDE